MIKQLLRAWLRPKSIGEGYITGYPDFLVDWLIS